MNIIQLLAAIVLFAGLSYFAAVKLKQWRDNNCEHHAMPEALQQQSELEAEVARHRARLVELSALHESATSQDTLLHIANTEDGSESQVECCSAVPVNPHP